MLVLGLAGVTSATTISLVAPEPGAPGSAENPLNDSDTIIIYLAGSDGDMDTLVSTISITGPGAIVDAVGASDNGTGTAFRYGGYMLVPGMDFWGGGWQPDLSFEAFITGDAMTAVIGLGQFGDRAYSSHANGVSPMGFVEIHCTGPGEVVVSIIEGDSDLVAFGSSQIYPNPPGGAPSYGGAITIYQIPEPTTVALLGLGGLLMLRRRRK